MSIKTEKVVVVRVAQAVPAVIMDVATLNKKITDSLLLSENMAAD